MLWFESFKQDKIWQVDVFTLARLFEIKDIVSLCFVKILKVNITNMLLVFDEKMCAKDSHIFSTKIYSNFLLIWLLFHRVKWEIFIFHKWRSKNILIFVLPYTTN